MTITPYSVREAIIDPDSCSRMSRLRKRVSSIRPDFFGTHLAKLTSRFREMMVIGLSLSIYDQSERTSLGFDRANTAT